jgi:hypothetical protein
MAECFINLKGQVSKDEQTLSYYMAIPVRAVKPTSILDKASLLSMEALFSPWPSTPERRGLHVRMGDRISSSSLRTQLMVIRTRYRRVQTVCRTSIAPFREGRLLTMNLALQCSYGTPAGMPVPPDFHRGYTTPCNLISRQVERMCWSFCPRVDSNVSGFHPEVPPQSLHGFQNPAHDLSLMLSDRSFTDPSILRYPICDWCEQVSCFNGARLGLGQTDGRTAFAAGVDSGTALPRHPQCISKVSAMQ